MTKQHYYRITLFFLLFPIFGCAQESEDAETDNPVDGKQSSLFGNPEYKGVLRNGEINEASGIAVSRKHPNAIWVHNDSGNDPLLFLIDQQANIIKTFLLDGIENRDWEDMTIGPGPDSDTHYIYLADIGDNLRLYENKIIYRFPEPVYDPSMDAATDTLQDFDVLNFSYPDQKQDAEALMLDPVTQDLYIIAKRSGQPTLYRLPADSWKLSVDTTVAEIVGEVNIKSSNLLSLVTAGDISQDGKEALVKTYGRVYYWKRSDFDMSIVELLSSRPDTLRYEPEPQGEAITFSRDPDGFFTLSEKRFQQNPVLYFYPRK